jgi:2-polyprenyl-6-methoxyphenol hydroxylase-like FAD-dependent oxidoreductase
MEVACCIAGCGPAGAVLGLLLARAGVDVLVLEKHADFLRDFRGDTLHPSTLQLFDELGLGDRLLELPHQEAEVLGVPPTTATSPWPTSGGFPGGTGTWPSCPHAQWDFLYRDQDGETHHVLARLTVAADGRGSRLRRSAGLRPTGFGAPMDVLWFRLPRRPADRPTFGRLAAGHLLVLIDRGEYWQVAYVIAKGALDELRQAGLDRLRASVAGLVPFLDDRVQALRTWDDVRELRVQLRRTLPSVIVQWGQRTIQDRFLSPLLAGRVGGRPPGVLRLLRRYPVLQGVPARLVGFGILPEHVKAPAPARSG